MTHTTIKGLKVVKMVLVLTCIFFTSFSSVLAEEIVRKRLLEHYVAHAPKDSVVQKYSHTLSVAGQWPDINYESKRRSGWDMVAHLKRLREMATAYANPKSRYHKDKKLLAKILKGLDHWLDKDYRNPNWFNARIGVPKQFGPIFILLGDDLPKPMLDRALKTVLNRTNIGMTGQNRVWCSGIVLTRGALTDDPKAIKAASDAIWGELKVTSKEGLQADWSFHQHGPQLQVGNYGKSFAGTMTDWAMILRGTDYAPSKNKLEILRNMMLESMAWYYWKGRWDLNACGRQVMNNCQASKARGVLSSMRKMMAIDPKNSARYELDKHQLNGFKGYWRSDCAVVRRPEWYASVRMCSTRTQGAETCNSENMQGLHQADGVLLHYRTGREYENIQPLWDWRRLPGTTCDQSLKKLRPAGRGKSSFGGVLSDGKIGIAAMIYKRGKLSARKAWFVFEDRIVCLGAGISGDTAGPVVTSVEQNLFADKAISSEGELGKGVTKIDANGWVLHNGAGYRLHTAGIVEIKRVKDTWKKIFPTRKQDKASGEVFSISINHGKSPNDATYAYTLFPSATKDILTGPKSKILYNTKNVQAVEWGDSLIAAFYAPGSITVEGERLSADKPCLIMRRNGKFFVSDPEQKSKKIKFGLNGTTVEAVMPKGEMAGSTIRVEI